MNDPQNIFQVSAKTSAEESGLQNCNLSADWTSKTETDKTAKAKVASIDGGGENRKWVLLFPCQWHLVSINLQTSCIITLIIGYWDTFWDLQMCHYKRFVRVSKYFTLLWAYT